MTIHRRTLIKDMLILVPAGYTGMKHLTPPFKPLQTKKNAVEAGAHYIYPHLLNPRDYPDDKRRFVQPPDWSTFDHKTDFTTLRSFRVEENKIVHYEEDLDIYTKIYALGNVIWPNRNFLSAENIPELIAAFKRRRLFLFDIWGYVPGSGPGTWTQFKLDSELSRLFNSELGDHWLGMDNGEQDGRYIGGYASQMYPASADRQHQYLNFQQHFEKLTDDLGSRMATLVSLNYGHYFLKEGVYTLIGAETAQALPNGQVYYSFIRGAGKQYGVPWFGNASVYNRWGYKSYDSEGSDHGPTKGTSLSLMKRLMYSHIMYNGMTVGFEAGWLYANKVHDTPGTKADKNALTPIGHIQQGAVKWIQKNGQPGVMYTPVALMQDFFAGWTFPRHLYSGNVYRVWGNLPYKAGDYLTDAVLDMLYPDYQNSSYYHDESGFMCATPYGDIADCILSDAENWLLAQYPLLVVTNELTGGEEIRDKLQNYIKNGGHLVITAGNLLKVPGGIGQIKVKGEHNRFKKGQVVSRRGKQLTEDVPFDFYPLSFPENADILATAANRPLAISTSFGRGRVTVFASPFGISSEIAVPPEKTIRSEEDKPLLKPYPVLKHVQAVLAEIFGSQQLFEVNDTLGLITCCRGQGKYLLGITNNTWHEQPFEISSHCGGITATRELTLDQSEKTALGYLPENINIQQIGNSRENSIAGGDIRIFEVTVQEQNTATMPRQVPPSRPEHRFLPLRDIRMIKEEILLRSTFFEHFNGVSIDWKYLQNRETSVLEQEAGWINRQKLQIIVDLTSGVDLYPELRLIDNLHADYEVSMNKIEDVIRKMEILHAGDLVLPLHRFPENNFTKQQTLESFKATFGRLSKYAKTYGIRLNLRLALGRPPYDLQKAIDFITEVEAPNLYLAPETAYLLARDTNIEKDSELIKDRVGFWLVSGLQKDLEGKYWNQNAPVFAGNNKKNILEIIGKISRFPVVLDGIYKSQDEEYRDARILDKLRRFK